MVMPSSPIHRPRNTSVSQGEMQNRCWRLWWLQRVARVREPQRQHFLVGGIMHEVIERVLRGEALLYPTGWDQGLTTGEAEWVQEAVARGRAQGLLQLEPGSYVEWPLVLLVGEEHLDVRGIPLVGQASIETAEDGRRVITPPTSLIDGSPLPPGWDRLPHLVGFIDHYHPRIGMDVPPKVRDQKSAKNRRYGKKKHDIRESLQMLAYACLPFGMFPDVEEADAGYNVFLKDPNAAHPVYAVSDRIHVEDSRARWRSFIDQTEYGEQLRKSFPMVGTRDSVGRAEHWRQVPGAVDIYQNDPKQIKERCDAFGGCPFRDLCFGRCNHEQITKRLDTAVAAGDVAATTPSTTQPVSYGLLPQEKTMPFGTPTQTPSQPPAITVGQDVVVPEPDDEVSQYAARVLQVGPDAKTYRVGFWPNPKVMPDFEQLPEAYCSELPAEMVHPHMVDGRNMANYQEALRKAGMEAPPWQPRGASEAVEESASPSSPRDEGAQVSGQYGLLPERESPPEPSADQTVQSHECWIGQQVHITTPDGANSFRGKCTAVDRAGMYLDPFEAPIAWDRVGSIVEMQKKPIPGDEKDAKRVAKKNHLEGLDIQGALNEIFALVEKAEAKNSPSLGKRDIAKLKEYLQVIVAQAQDGGALAVPTQTDVRDQIGGADPALVAAILSDGRFVQGVQDMVRDGINVPY